MCASGTRTKVKSTNKFESNYSLIIFTLVGNSDAYFILIFLVQKLPFSTHTHTHSLFPFIEAISLYLMLLIIIPLGHNPMISYYMLIFKPSFISFPTIFYFQEVFEYFDNAFNVVQNFALDLREKK